MNDPNWHRVTSLTELQSTGRKLFRKNGRQIVVFYTTHGLFACNNRCPHEGYPLSEATLDDRCVLTCNWHNWKFKLANGDNLYGGDRLRVYPAAVRDEQVWIDISDPPFDIRRAEILDSLRDAFQDNVYDRIGREIARFSLLGADPLDVVREAIVWSYEHMEFGWTHGFAAAADWLALYDQYRGDKETQLICLLESVAHLADDVLRESIYPYPEQQTTYDEDAFVYAIEAQDESRAISLLCGALGGGLGFAELEPGFTRAALSHYSDFGHSLIYTVKAGRLIERLGAVVTWPLLAALTRSLVFATREDLIPEFRNYAAQVTQWGENPGTKPATIDAYKGLSINQAMDFAGQACDTPVGKHYNALLGINAYNMLAYNTYYQEQTTRPIQDNVGWLDFTHGLTFANAVRIQCTKFPGLWPAGLLQLACFCGRNSPYTDTTPDLDRWQVKNPDSFMRHSIESIFDHGVDEFIISVHVLKTVCAVREELQNCADVQTRVYMLASINRFLHEPLKRKHARRTAQQSINFVARDG